MQNGKLKAVVVGLGFGGAFVPIWRDHPDVAEVGVCELDPNLRERVSAEHGISLTYASLDEVLADGEDTLLVGHNGALATLIIQLLDMQPRAVTHIWMLHGCYTSVDISHGFVRLEYFNK